MEGVAVGVNWVFSWKFGGDYIISTLWLGIFRLAEIALDIERKYYRDTFEQLKLSWTMRLRQKLPANNKWLNCNLTDKAILVIYNPYAQYLHNDTFVWYITSFVTEVCNVYLMGMPVYIC